VIPARVFDLHARRQSVASVWLLASLLVSPSALAQRRIPEPVQAVPPSLDFSEPARSPFLLPNDPSPVATPVRDPSSSPAPPVAKVSTGLVSIESDIQRADQSTGVVTSIGNVRIVYPDQRVVATARQAQYFTKEGRVVLSGDVDVVQEGGNLLRAEQVVYLVNSQRLLAIPPQGKQVYAQMRMPARSTRPLKAPSQASASAPSP
jgi:lipopolysaccharide export system protein LptA